MKRYLASGLTALLPLCAQAATSEGSLSLYNVYGAKLDHETLPFTAGQTLQVQVGLHIDAAVATEITLVTEGYLPTSCDWYITSPGARPVRVAKGWTPCDWPGREVTKTSFTGRIDIRNLKELKEAGDLMLKCETSDVKLKTNYDEIGCDLKTPDTVAQNAAVRSEFTFDNLNPSARKRFVEASYIALLTNFGEVITAGANPCLSFGFAAADWWAFAYQLKVQTAFQRDEPLDDLDGWKVYNDVMSGTNAILHGFSCYENGLDKIFDVTTSAYLWDLFAGDGSFDFRPSDVTQYFYWVELAIRIAATVLLVEQGAYEWLISEIPRILATLWMIVMNLFFDV